MKPIPIIKKELDRNGVIGFLSITKEKLSNFFNRTFVDTNELPNKTERKRKSRTTKNSRRASLDKHPVNGKVVKSKLKLKAPKTKAKVQINGASEHNGNNNELEHKSDKSPMTNGHSPNKTTPTSTAAGSTPAPSSTGNPARKRKSVSPDKKSAQSDLKSSTKDVDNEPQLSSSKKTEKIPKVKAKKDKTKHSFNEDRHRKFCSTKCNVSNFDDLNELQLELERRLCVIEKYKQTLEFERIRLDKAADISNFLISKPKAKFAKLRSIVLGGDPDWDSQLRPPPRMKKSQRSVHKAIQSAHNAFTPLFSLTVSTKAASNYLSSPRIVTQLEPDSVEHLKKIIKNFNRLLTNDDLITPLYKPIFTECQLEFADFVKQLTDTKLDDNYCAEKFLALWKDQTQLYQTLVPSVSLNNLDDFRCYLQTLKIDTKPVTACSNGALKVVKDERQNEISPRKKCRQNDGSPSILRQLLSTPPKVSPCNSVSVASLSGLGETAMCYGADAMATTASAATVADNPLVKLNFAQLDDLRRRTSMLLTKIRDFAHEFAPLAAPNTQTHEQSQAVFASICADIDSTAKMCSFMNGNLPIFTSNCLGCQPLPAHRPSSAPSSASSSSYPTSSSPSSCSTQLWSSSSGSSSSSSAMSTYSTSVAMGTASTPDSVRLRLMTHCGELCGALTPEPVQPIESVDYGRPKKWKWGNKKRSSPKKSRRRKPQSDLVRKRRSPVRLKITDDDTEIEEDDDDVCLTFDDFDDIQLVEISDIDMSTQDLNRLDLDAFVSSFNVRTNFLEIADDCCDGDGLNTRLVPPFMLENNSSPKKFASIWGSGGTMNNSNNSNNTKTISTPTEASSTPVASTLTNSVPATAGKTRRKMVNGVVETKPTKIASPETKTASLPSAGVQSSDLLDSVICRLVERHLIPLMQQNDRQIDSLKTSLHHERARQQKLAQLRHDYVELLDTIYKYLIKNRAILKKDNDILCKTLDQFIQLATELQQPEFWITPEDLGEDFLDSVFHCEYKPKQHCHSVVPDRTPDDCAVNDGAGDDVGIVGAHNHHNPVDVTVDVYSFNDDANNSVQPQQSPGQNICSNEHNTESINIY